MATPLNSSVFLAVVAFSAGCISFEQQTVSYQHDAARDRLLVHIVHSGIHGDARPKGLTEAEQADLLEAVQGRQVYLFDSWLPIVDLDALCIDLAEPVNPHVSEAAQQAEIALRDWRALLAVNIQISNGPFYVDGAGHLSAVQHITVSNVRALVQSGNRVWRQQAEARLIGEPDEPEWMMAASIADPVQLNGNQLVLRYLADGELPGERRWLDAGVLNVLDGVATLTLGSPAAPRVTFATSPKHSYQPSAVEFVRHRFGLAERFDPRADADAFFAGARAPQFLDEHRQR
jgi:hypothetical protein